MGLMPLAEAEWIEIDALFAAHLAEKRALLETRHGEVFAALPQGGRAGRGITGAPGGAFAAPSSAIFLGATAIS